jgi:hypothetical protein
MGDPIDRRLLRRAVAVGCAVVLVAGCGAGDDEVDAANTTVVPDPTSTTATSEATTSTEGTTSTTAATALAVCEIITVGDIEAALGVVVPEGEEMEEPGEEVCSYDSGAREAEVAVFRYEPVGDLLPTTLAGDPTAVELSSVNDEAVLQLERGTITLRRGDVGVAISVFVSPIAEGPAVTEEILVQLAQTASAKL